MRSGCDRKLEMPPIKPEEVLAKCKEEFYIRLEMHQDLRNIIRMKGGYEALLTLRKLIDRYF